MIRSSMFLIRTVFCLVLSQLVIGMAIAESLDHSKWNELLSKYVAPINDGKSTAVDYSGFLDARAQLKQYLNFLESVNEDKFDELSKDEQLAFLINAYNAWTVELILTEYPDLDSIKDLGGFFSSPWKQKFIPLLGETRSLDNVEHNLIRGSDRYADARIHFAVNCASIGCPALRAEAYVGEKLEAQLEEQTKLFLADDTRNRVSENELQVSSIFKWYREDFETGWSGFDSLDDFFIQYSEVLGLSKAQKTQLKEGDMDIEFLDYDWDLNKQ